MSYILEALRKSEQERNPEVVPNLTTQHQMPVKETKSKLGYWIFGVALIAVNGFLLAYIMLGDKQENSIPALVKTDEAVKIENTEILNKIESQLAAIEIEPVIIQPEVEQVIVQEQVIESNPQGNPPGNQPSYELEQASIPNIFDLEYSFQQTIPDMDFTTHIYVSSGGSFVIINGKSLSENMAVGRGLMLTQVLSDGVVLRFKGRLFFLASMTSWQRD